MKLSDYVVRFLEEKKVEDVFLLAGGGIMHLLDSLAKSKKINKYYNLHEQASGFAADGYAQYSNKLGVVFATTGPGATNVVTPLASAYIDSTPMLVISGQVKTSDITSIPGVRQTGAQEVGIVPIVDSITKYAVTIIDPRDIRCVLEKALYLATTGRPGPVWIDIPLDVQSAEVDVDTMQGFLPNMSEGQSDGINKKILKEIWDILKSSKCPCIFAGTGIILADGKEELVSLVNELHIPTVTSRRAKRLFHVGNDRYYYGNAGGVATRYANYVLQNADVVLVLGSGLRYYLTEFNEEHFAYKAKKIIVNIEKAEIDKLRMPVEKSIVCDVKIFIHDFLQYIFSTNERGRWEDWIAYADEMKNKYPVENEDLPHADGLTDGYMVSKAMNKYSNEDDVYVASPSAFAYTYHLCHLRGAQEYICPVGLGSMGTAIPAAIGVCIASGKKRTIVGEGDGSLQHNIQELALLQEYRLPIKIFIDSNDGYRQIYTMQQSHFSGRFAGCTRASGVAFPELKYIAMAYNIKYYCIEKAIDTEHIVQVALSDDEPAIIEMKSSPSVEFVPIVKSKMGEDGKMVTSTLEDLYPFLSNEEQCENMKVKQVYEKGTI